MSRPPNRLPSYTMAVQAYHISGLWPKFLRSGNARASTWLGWMQPKSEAPRYSVSIRYEIDRVPIIRVTKPILLPDAPHLYPEGDLCLYYPPDWTWHGGRLLAETILPWTAGWLFFYELWLDTGEWLGPSAPHEPQRKEPRPR